MKKMQFGGALVSLTVPVAGFLLYAACGGGGSATCADPAFKIAFSPMYSAYENGHSYQIPAIVVGLTNSKLAWRVGDPSIATITDDDTTGGVMITIKKAGKTTITASGGSLCGSADLTVTSASPDLWAAGNALYNDTTTPNSCVDCHSTASTNHFKDISHTPQQTGGYSDGDLTGIIRDGVVPDGGYFDGSLVSLRAFATIHKFNVTDQQLQGLIVYLRSLKPTPQTGTADFGGRWRPDGGAPPNWRSDGGAVGPYPGPARDAGPSPAPGDSDAGTSTTDAGGSLDAGAPADAGHATTDAGHATTDAGHATTDAG